MGVCLDLVAHFYHDFDIWKIVIDNVLKSWLLWIWIIIFVPMIHDLDIWIMSMSSNHDHHPNDLPESGGRQKPGRATVVVHVSHSVGCVCHLHFHLLHSNPFTFTSKNDTFNHSLSHSETCFNKMFTTFHIFRCISIICYLRLQSSIFSHILFKSVTFRCIRNLGTWFDFSTYGR